MTSYSSYNYDIHGILKVNSYSERYIPKYFLTLCQQARPDIAIRLVGAAEIARYIGKSIQIRPGIYCSDCELIISMIEIFGFRIMWALKQLLRKPTEIFITRGYENLSNTILRMPVGNVFPIRSFLEKIVHVKLLLNGYTLLIGGCLEPDNAKGAIVISSNDGAGKTTTVLRALRAFGGQYLSDDKIIIDKKGTVYAYPEPIALRRRALLPITIDKHMSPAEMFNGPIRMAKSSRVTAVFFLEQAGEQQIIPIEPEHALVKLLAINGKMLPYYMERTILAYSYANHLFNIRELMQREMKILRDFLRHADCYILRRRFGYPGSYVRMLETVKNA